MTYRRTNHTAYRTSQAQAASQQSSLKCDNGHPLGPRTRPSAGVFCDKCRADIPDSGRMLYCGQCNFDMCLSCAAKAIQVSPTGLVSRQGRCPWRCRVLIGSMLVGGLLSGVFIFIFYGITGDIINFSILLLVVVVVLLILLVMFSRYYYYYYYSYCDYYD